MPYWETVRVLRASDAPLVGRTGQVPSAVLTYLVLESNKTYRVGNVHTVRVFGEYITRALTAHAMQVRLVAHVRAGMRTDSPKVALYPLEPTNAAAPAP